ncbi:MAG: SDR family oxidoreductase [Deltaproteobacteria bacterium]|nr:SDR family oxidoreductase [Deltaproteobacteria bacterium]NND29044.1 SDR family oxidoreductase [Myxococcales bacterium]MBT8464252.1 SDR family oxidoreductase [Deltaproteobacteria bacterium]MBT8480063.1 SDR family oxidoreductase [Deltaproteobacteria bacterium]NNK05988.1 SDR family oxidoreductase [Myxococcales bacterium]
MSEKENPVPVAIVTGASSGIGEATAHCLAEAGYAVVVAARRTELLDRLVTDIRARGGTALSAPTDLSDAAETSALVRTALDAFGRVDVLVNNAGYGPPYALEQMDRAAMRHVFDVNLLSAMQLIAELTPPMREQGGGRVINISSLSRYVGAPLASAYAATKGGMEALTACMRLELSPWNIKLTLIVPGFVDTPTFDKSRAAGQHLRQDPANPYRQLMEDLDAFATEQLKSAVSPEEVGRAVVRAATAQSPKARYFVPKSARTAARIFGALPDLVADRLLLKMYKWGPWA